MKNLNLNAYGVSEMDSAEMQTVEGGCILTALIVAAVVIVAAIFASDDNPDTQTYVNGQRVGN